MSPLVSIICVSYNHERFVVEALESVKRQSYPNIELIIVDDGSQDKSVDAIEGWLLQNPNAQFLNLKTNHGYCTAFNKAFVHAKGEFYIDLSADDLLLPNRVVKGVEGFLKKGDRYGIQFSDAEYITTEGQVIKKGETVIVLEAMKMENSLKAAADATVKKVMAVKGAAVEKNEVLVQLSPS